MLGEYQWSSSTLEPHHGFGHGLDNKSVMSKTSSRALKKRESESRKSHLDESLEGNNCSVTCVC